jgi:hypothetical protein
MSIHVGDQTYVYRGRAVPRVYRRLQALLDSKQGDGTGLYQQNERVLFGGRLILLVNNFIGASGEFVLTDSCFRFQAGEGLVPRMWSGLSGVIEIPLNEIKEVSMAGIRRRLKLATSKCQYRFGGRLAPQLFSHLASCVGNRPHSSRDERVLESWKVDLYSGPLASPGRLVLSTHRMHFEPGRRLDAALGVQGQDTLWHEVRSIRLRGRLDRRIQFECDNRTLTIDTKHVAAHFLDLVALYRESRGPNDPSFDANGELAEGDARYILQQWREHLPVSNLARILSATPALHWVDAWWMRRGWLVLTTDQLLFVPSGTPRDEAGGASLSLEQCTITESREDNAERLILETEDRKWFFSPLAGEAFAERVSQLLGDQPRVPHWEHEWGAQFLPLIGDAAFVEFTVDEEMVDVLRPAQLFPHEDGIGIFFRRRPDNTLHVGVEATLRVASPSGLYELHGTVVVNQNVASGHSGAGDESIHLLVLAQSPELSLTDRRHHYRVDAVATISGHCMNYTATRGWVENKHPIRCVLEDLSVGGCALYGSREMEVRSHIMLNLPPRTDPHRIEGEVMECIHRPDGPQPWYARVQFIRLVEDDVRRITEQIVRFQQGIEEPGEKA